MEKDGYFRILETALWYDIDNFFNDSEWASMCGISQMSTSNDILQDRDLEEQDEASKKETHILCQKVHNRMDKYYKRKNNFFMKMAAINAGNRFKSEELTYIKNSELERLALLPFIEQSYPGMNPVSSWPVSLNDLALKIASMEIADIFHQPFDYDGIFMSQCKEYITQSFKTKIFFEYLSNAISVFLSMFLLNGSQIKLFHCVNYLKSLKEQYPNDFPSVFKEAISLSKEAFTKVTSYLQSLNHYPILKNYQLIECYSVNKINLYASSKYVYGSSNSITSDGTYIYLVQSGVNGYMMKIGTGRNETIKGKVYFQKILMEEDTYQWVFLKDKLYAKIGLNDTISIFDPNTFELLRKVQLLLPDSVKHNAIKKQSENFTLLTNGEDLQVLTIEPAINANSVSPLPNTDISLYVSQEYDEENLNNSSSKQKEKEALYDSFSGVNLVLLSFNVDQNNQSLSLENQKDKLIKELHESFSYYFSYENCFRALLMFNWDFEKAAMYLIDNSDQVKEEILISHDKKVLYTCKLDGIKSLNNNYEFKIATNEHIDLCSFKTLKWIRTKEYLIGYKFKDGCCFLFDNNGFINKMPSIQFTKIDYLFTYDLTSGFYFLFENYSILSQKVIVCDCLQKSLNEMQGNIDEVVSLKGLDNPMETIEDVESFMYKIFLLFSSGKKYAAYWRYRSWNFFYNSYYDSLVYSLRDSDPKGKKINGFTKNLMPKIEKMHMFNQKELLIIMKERNIAKELIECENLHFLLNKKSKNEGASSSKVINSPDWSSMSSQQNFVVVNKELFIKEIKEKIKEDEEKASKKKEESNKKETQEKNTKIKRKQSNEDDDSFNQTNEFNNSPNANSNSNGNKTTVITPNTPNHFIFVENKLDTYYGYMGNEETFNMIIDHYTITDNSLSIKIKPNKEIEFLYSIYFYLENIDIGFLLEYLNSKPMHPILIKLLTLLSALYSKEALSDFKIKHLIQAIIILGWEYFFPTIDAQIKWLQIIANDSFTEETQLSSIQTNSESSNLIGVINGRFSAFAVLLQKIVSLYKINSFSSSFTRVNTVKLIIMSYYKNKLFCTTRNESFSPKAFQTPLYSVLNNDAINLKSENQKITLEIYKMSKLLEFGAIDLSIPMTESPHSSLATQAQTDHLGVTLFKVPSEFLPMSNVKNFYNSGGHSSGPFSGNLLGYESKQSQSCQTIINIEDIFEFNSLFKICQFELSDCNKEKNIFVDLLTKKGPNEKIRSSFYVQMEYNLFSDLMEFGNSFNLGNATKEEKNKKAYDYWAKLNDVLISEISNETFADRKKYAIRNYMLYNFLLRKVFQLNTTSLMKLCTFLMSRVSIPKGIEIISSQGYQIENEKVFEYTINQGESVKIYEVVSFQKALAIVVEFEIKTQGDKPNLDIIIVSQEHSYNNIRDYSINNYGSFGTCYTMKLSNMALDKKYILIGSEIKIMTNTEYSYHSRYTKINTIQSTKMPKSFLKIKCCPFREKEYYNTSSLSCSMSFEDRLQLQMNNEIDYYAILIAKQLIRSIAFTENEKGLNDNNIALLTAKGLCKPNIQNDTTIEQMPLMYLFTDVSELINQVKLRTTIGYSDDIVASVKMIKKLYECVNKNELNKAKEYESDFVKIKKHIRDIVPEPRNYINLKRIPSFNDQMKAYWNICEYTLLLCLFYHLNVSNDFIQLKKDDFEPLYLEYIGKKLNGLLLSMTGRVQYFKDTFDNIKNYSEIIVNLNNAFIDNVKQILIDKIKNEYMAIKEEEAKELMKQEETPKEKTAPKEKRKKTLEEKFGTKDSNYKKKAKASRLYTELPKKKKKAQGIEQEKETPKNKDTQESTNALEATEKKIVEEVDFDKMSKLSLDELFEKYPKYKGDINNKENIQKMKKEIVQVIDSDIKEAYFGNTEKLKNICEVYELSFSESNLNEALTSYSNIVKKKLEIIYNFYSYDRVEVLNKEEVLNKIYAESPYKKLAIAIIDKLLFFLELANDPSVKLLDEDQTKSLTLTFAISKLSENDDLDETGISKQSQNIVKAMFNLMHKTIDLNKIRKTLFTQIFRKKIRDNGIQVYKDFITKYKGDQFGNSFGLLSYGFKSYSNVKNRIYEIDKDTFLVLLNENMKNLIHQIDLLPLSPEDMKSTKTDFICFTLKNMTLILIDLIFIGSNNPYSKDTQETKQIPIVIPSSTPVSPLTQINFLIRNSLSLLKREDIKLTGKLSKFVGDFLSNFKLFLASLVKLNLVYDTLSITSSIIESLFESLEKITNYDSNINFIFSLLDILYHIIMNIDDHYTNDSFNKGLEKLLNMIITSKAPEIVAQGVKIAKLFLKNSKMGETNFTCLFNKIGELYATGIMKKSLILGNGDNSELKYNVVIQMNSPEIDYQFLINVLYAWEEEYPTDVSAYKKDCVWKKENELKIVIPPGKEITHFIPLKIKVSKTANLENIVLMKKEALNKKLKEFPGKIERYYKKLDDSKKQEDKKDEDKKENDKKDEDKKENDKKDEDKKENDKKDEDKKDEDKKENDKKDDKKDEDKKDEEKKEDDKKDEDKKDEEKKEDDQKEEDNEDQKENAKKIADIQEIVEEKKKILEEMNKYVEEKKRFVNEFKKIIKEGEIGNEEDKEYLDEKLKEKDKKKSGKRKKKDKDNDKHSDSGGSDIDKLKKKIKKKIFEKSKEKDEKEAEKEKPQEKELTQEDIASMVKELDNLPKRIQYLTRIYNHIKQCAKIGECASTRGYVIIEMRAPRALAEKFSQTIMKGFHRLLPLIPSDESIELTGYPNDQPGPLFTHTDVFPNLFTMDQLLPGCTNILKEITKSFISCLLIETDTYGRLQKTIIAFSNKTAANVIESDRHHNEQQSTLQTLNTNLNESNQQILNKTFISGQSLTSIIDSLVSLITHTLTKDDNENIVQGILAKATQNSNCLLGILITIAGGLKVIHPGVKIVCNDGTIGTVVSGGYKTGLKNVNVTFDNDKSGKTEKINLDKVKNFTEAKIIQMFNLKTIFKLFIEKCEEYSKLNTDHPSYDYLSNIILFLIKIISIKTKQDDCSYCQMDPDQVVKIIDILKNITKSINWISIDEDELEVYHLDNWERKISASSESAYYAFNPLFEDIPKKEDSKTNDNTNVDLITNYCLPDSSFVNQLPTIEDTSKSCLALKNIAQFERYTVEEVFKYAKKNYQDHEYVYYLRQVRQELSINDIANGKNDIYVIFDQTKVPPGMPLPQEHRDMKEIFKEECYPGNYYLAKMNMKLTRDTGINYLIQNKFKEISVLVLLVDNSLGQALVVFNDYQYCNLRSFWINITHLSLLDYNLKLPSSSLSFKRLEEEYSMSYKNLQYYYSKSVMSNLYLKMLQSFKINNMKTMTEFIDLALWSSTMEDPIEGILKRCKHYIPVKKKDEGAELTIKKLASARMDLASPSNSGIYQPKCDVDSILSHINSKLLLTSNKAAKLSSESSQDVLDIIEMELSDNDDDNFSLSHMKDLCIEKLTQFQSDIKHVQIADIVKDYQEQLSSKFTLGNMGSKLLSLHTLAGININNYCGCVLSFEQNGVLGPNAKLTFYGDGNGEKLMQEVRSIKSERTNVESVVFTQCEIWLEYTNGTTAFYINDWDYKSRDSTLPCTITFIPSTWPSLIWLIDYCSNAAFNQMDQDRLELFQAIIIKLLPLCTSLNIPAELQLNFFTITNRVILKAIKFASNLGKNIKEMSISDKFSLIGFDEMSFFGIIKNVDNCLKNKQTKNFSSSYIVDQVEILLAVLSFVKESYQSLENYLKEVFEYSLPIWIEAIVKLGNFLSFLQGNTTLEPNLMSEIKDQISLKNIKQFNSMFMIKNYNKELTPDQLREKLKEIIQKSKAKMVNSSADIQIIDNETIIFIIDGFNVEVLKELPEEEEEKEEPPKEEFWVCSCGFDNAMENEYCCACDKEKVIIPKEKPKEKKSDLIKIESYFYSVTDLANELKEIIKNDNELKIKPKEKPKPQTDKEQSTQTKQATDKEQSTKISQEIDKEQSILINQEIDKEQSIKINQETEVKKKSIDEVSEAKPESSELKQEPSELKDDKIEPPSEAEPVLELEVKHGNELIQLLESNVRQSINVFLKLRLVEYISDNEYYTTKLSKIDVKVQKDTLNPIQILYNKLKALEMNKASLIEKLQSEIETEDPNEIDYIGYYKLLEEKNIDLYHDSLDIVEEEIELNRIEKIRELVDLTLCKESTISYVYPSSSIRFISTSFTNINHTPYNIIENYYKELLPVPLSQIRYYWAIIRYFNSCLLAALPFIKPPDAYISAYFDKEDKDYYHIPFPKTISMFLSSVKGITFSTTKMNLIRDVLKFTEFSEEEVQIPTFKFERLNIANKQESTDDNGATALGMTESMFLQAYDQAKDIDPAFFRSSKAPGDPHLGFKIEFKGELVQGLGGPYRQFFSDISLELQPKEKNKRKLNLFIPSPNNLAGYGDFKDKFVIKPSYCSNSELNHFEFLGVLFGICIRTGVFIPIDLSTFIWKKITDTPITVDDLKEFDEAIIEQVIFMQEIDVENFESYNLTYSCQLSDGSIVALIPNGQYERVMYEDRGKYLELCFKARLTESDKQIAAIKRGLYKLIPPSLIKLLTHKELERLVTGSLDKDIDIDLLKMFTKYTMDLTEESPRAKWLWEILKEFTPSDRRKFIKFCWGQERLPSTKSEYENLQVDFKIKPYMDKSKKDVFPKADTCFFFLELPEYSSKEIMKNKILTAINLDNVSINADKAGVENRGNEERLNNIDEDEDYYSQG